MLIQCTKKLLEQLKLNPESEVEGEALFSWHANLITLNRRKTVVLVNDQNRYTVVLYGLKAKDFNKINEIVVGGIRETFREEGIKDGVIEKYLFQSKKLIFAKTKNRTSVARMNKACENVYYFEELLDSHSIINSEMGVRISSILVGDGKNSYILPNEEMYKDLENFAGEKIFSTKAVQLKVNLKLEENQVWRRIIVPLNRSFEELHEIIQKAFGWRDYHLHEFYIYESTISGIDLSTNHPTYLEAGYRPILNIVCSDEAFEYPNDVEMILEKGIRLSDYLPTYKKLKYNYDFGDNWQHVIEVEKTIDDYDQPYPICLEGEGNTPPEDVGGEGGYEEFLEILANPEHSDYQHTVKWGLSQGYADFDIACVNRVLKRK
ncbi:plasmid pRiA4b ORF-3 family protein [Bacillus sp. 1NLA3E]|uniref:plasmid pRiA4b ORF-3 family protein n=1 Tax=Bacillus sp. 1NLA3E TaxID=666686 RepID=UPI000247F19A|nr:plasmid pRiA4b ORF-3 family protein [Bacillus sp. 1NLA3E]AGK54017.1 plasmid pRiA4b ORF-3 family protein [Bacillus sp. 1NLA3E]